MSHERRSGVVDRRAAHAIEAPEAARGSRQRVIVEHVQPEIDGGRFPIKRTIGELVSVTADIFADGHDLLGGTLRYRHQDGDWEETPLAALGNDVWGASFVVIEPGEYEYTIEAWVDRFGSWLKALVLKAEAGQDVASELLEGAELVQTAAAGADDLHLLELAD